MICDFCTTPNPAWRFGARALTLQYVPGLTGECDTGWAACDICHDLIVADDRNALAMRGVTVARATDAPIEQELQMQLWAQDLFFKHRVNEPPTRIA